MAKLTETLCVLQKCTNPQSKLFVVPETCTELCGTMDVWNTVSLPSFVLDPKRAIFLQKEQKTERFLANVWISR